MYIQLRFYELSDEQKELLLAKLYQYCEGFEEYDDSIIASVKAENYNREFKDLMAEFSLQPEIEEIPEQNWNAVWESNFDPVVVDDFVAVRADFHQPIKDVAHEIIITPKMSFGTGHHATTHLMMQQMRQMDFRGKSVFDFGTGTGILAILAKKLGAVNVIATDIDPWSIENAAENFTKNGIGDISLRQSASPLQHIGSAMHEPELDIILANINKNVLLETIPQLTSTLRHGGVLMLSGILEADEEIITELCTQNSLLKAKHTSKNGWIVLVFNKL